MLTALFLDTETTGLDPATASVVELAWALVHCDQGRFRIVEAHSVLLYPGQEALTAAVPEALKVAGLESAVVEAFGVGSGIARSLTSLLELLEIDAVVAWNAPFDVAFLDRILPSSFHRRGVLVDAMRNIPWKELGASSLGLATVAAEVGGFVNPVPHCAITDVITTVKLVAPRLEAAIEDARSPRATIILTSTRFEANQTLKAMGFHFEPSDKSWRKSMLEKEAQDVLLRVGNLGTARIEVDKKP